MIILGFNLAIIEDLLPPNFYFENSHPKAKKGKGISFQCQVTIKMKVHSQLFVTYFRNYYSPRPPIFFIDDPNVSLWFPKGKKQRDEAVKAFKYGEKIFEDGAAYCKKLNKIMMEDEQFENQRATGNVHTTL